MSMYENVFDMIEALLLERDETLAALAAIPAGWDVSFEVWQDGEWMAASDLEYDAMHYAAMYGQDGPVEVFRVLTKRESLTPPLPANSGGERLT